MYFNYYCYYHFNYKLVITFLYLFILLFNYLECKDDNKKILIEPFKYSNFYVDYSYDKNQNIKELNIKNIGYNLPVDFTKYDKDKLLIVFDVNVKNFYKLIFSHSNSICKPKLFLRYQFKCLYAFNKQFIEKNNLQQEFNQISNTKFLYVLYDTPEFKQNNLTKQNEYISLFSEINNKYPNYKNYAFTKFNSFISVIELVEMLRQYSNENTIFGNFILNEKKEKDLFDYYNIYYTYPNNNFYVLSKEILNFIGSWNNYYLISPTIKYPQFIGYFLNKYERINNNKVQYYNITNMYEITYDYKKYIKHSLVLYLNCSSIESAYIELNKQYIKDGYLK